MGGSFENQARQAIKAKNFTALRRICDAAIQAGQTTPQLMIWSANLDRESGDFQGRMPIGRPLKAPAEEFSGVV